MHRTKRHKIKHEKPETSSAFTKTLEEHDLAYYIHDRVELMHQVFSILKAKDLKAMAPECVRRLSIDDLQELCTEELLGISSKRLLAILDGAEPPSDTESSSQSSEHLEAISLDSISSDEEILSQGTKKKRKHKRRDSKSKKHKRKPDSPQEQPEKNRASRAGLTVLELLELQARARAIRAQLQEHSKRSETAPAVGVESSHHSDDSDIEVKEEPAEVVEISSDDEKPRIERLEISATSNNKEPETATNKASTEDSTKNGKDSSKKRKKKDKTNKKEKEKKQKEPVSSKDSDKVIETSKASDETKVSAEKNQSDAVVVIENDANTKSGSEDSHRVTKRVNDLIITVPQQTTRKIKLNRNKMTVCIANSTEHDVPIVENMRTMSSVVSRPEKPDEGKNISSVVSRPKKIESVIKKAARKQTENDSIDKETDKVKNKEKSKKKQRKKSKRVSVDEDHDEITLQLSDSEKMDLLENFDKRNYDNVSSSSSDSESSSSDESKHSDITSTQNTSKDSQENTEGISKDAILDESQSSPVKETQQDKTIDVSKKNDTEIEKCESDCNNSMIEEQVDNCNKDDKGDTAPDEEEECVKANSEEQEKCLTVNNEEKSDTCNVEDTKNVDNANKDPSTESVDTESENALIEVSGFISTENKQSNVIEISKIDDIPVKDDSEKESNVSDMIQYQDKGSGDLECKDNSPKSNKEDQLSKDKGELIEDIAKKNNKELSEGELSEHDSSEVEAFEHKPEVVCISDEETPKKKKKKDKKAKKEKKDKSVFRESTDQNFYQDSMKSMNESGDQETDKKDKNNKEEELISLDDDDDIFEILELSDDSSCYEVEGTTLSKEPTVEEIAALSAKIDEIEREEVVTEQEILIHEKMLEEKKKKAEETSSKEEIENISWKDRYLDSKKVKKVLTTANILNALRKKNKELKKKMEESKKKEQELEAEKLQEDEKKKSEEDEKVLEEGSIQQYNTLEASTTYVDPVPDPVELAKKKAQELKEQEMKEAQELKEQEIKEAETIKEKEKEVEDAIKAQVTGEMKKDAKQLLSMYKKLLKYNDIKKQKDPNKKKSKKKKKKEKDSLNVASS